MEWYLPPTEQFALVMDMENDVCLNLETDYELPQLPWDTDMVSLNYDWTGQPSHGTEFVPRAPSISPNSTSDHWIDNSSGNLNDRIPRNGYLQLYGNLDYGNSSAVSVLAFDAALSSESPLPTQGYRQLPTQSASADMSEQTSLALPSPPNGLCVCEICAKSFDKKCQLKYVNTSNVLPQQPYL
jgi:hypothetical protein